MNKKLQNWIEKKIETFINEVLLEWIRDFTVKFFDELRLYNLSNTFLKNKLHRNLYISNVLIHSGFLFYNDISYKFTIPYSLLSYFAYKALKLEIREEIFRRRYKGFGNMFNNQAKIINKTKNKEAGMIDFTVKTFIPREKIISKKSELENYFNTNIVDMVEHKFDKRKLNIVTSKNNTISKKLDNSTIENKLINILNSYQFNAIFKNKKTNDFFDNIYVDCNVDIKKVLSRIDDIAYKLKIDSSRLEINVDKGVFVFQIKKDKQKAFLFSDHIDNIKIEKKYKFPFVIGMHQESNVCIVDDLINISHSLIVGKSGSGKSSTANMIIQSLMYLSGNSMIKWIMFDYKMTEFRQYENFRNVTYLSNDEERLIEALKSLNEEVHKRFKMLSDLGYKDINSYNSKNKNKIPTIVLIIDEAAEIQFSENADKINSLLASMINRMRASNVVLFFALQKHTGNQIDTRIRGQFKTEFLHRFDNKDKKGLLIDVPVFKLKKGEFYINSDDYEYVKMKGLLIDDDNNKTYEILKEKYSK